MLGAIETDFIGQIGSRRAQPSPLAKTGTVRPREHAKVLEQNRAS